MHTYEHFCAYAWAQFLNFYAPSALYFNSNSLTLKRERSGGMDGGKRGEGRFTASLSKQIIVIGSSNNDNNKSYWFTNTMWRAVMGGSPWGRWEQTHRKKQKKSMKSAKEVCQLCVKAGGMAFREGWLNVCVCAFTCKQLKGYWHFVKSMLPKPGDP